MNANTAVTPKPETKITAKDSVFGDLFRNPKYLLQLYQALHPEDTETTEADIGTVTITNILLNQMYNDLGFMVGKDHPKLMILLEAQTIWSINIVIRIVMYLAKTWQEYIESHALNIYSSKKIDLPKPELYVIYTGTYKSGQEWISLADEFFSGDDTFLDVKVKVIYNGEDGDIINQYVIFTKVFNEQVKQLGRTRKAVLETIRICKDRNVLREYLEDREKEVIDIMMTLFDQEHALELYGNEIRSEGKAEGMAEGKAEGMAEGIIKGRSEGMAEGLVKGKAEGRVEGELKKAQEMAFVMREKGFHDDTIAEILKVGVDVVHQWLAEPSPLPQ